MFAVSHTTDDLIFKWDLSMPLDVDSGIELPQLELTNNFTGDCTTAYSTGANIYIHNQHFFATLQHVGGICNFRKCKQNQWELKIKEFLGDVVFMFEILRFAILFNI